MIERFSPQSLAKRRRKLWWRQIAPIYLSWLAPVGTVFGAIVAGADPAFTLLFGSFLGLLPTIVTASNASAFLAFRQRGAARDWAILTHPVLLQKRLSKPTREVKAKIARIYRFDTQAQIFPLHQALSLLDVHHRQQERLLAIDARLRDTQMLEGQLCFKINQLKSLGQQSQSGEQSLAELREERVRLYEAKSQIAASCGRLELLLLQIEQTAQSRALHSEISELSARASHRTPAALPSSETPDLERQITREIESYLALEKQSEEVLRSL